MYRSILRALRARTHSVLAAIRCHADADDPVRELYRRAVAGLPPRQRQIFMLQRADGLTIAEIARQLDMPSREVEQEFARALLAIARTIEPSP